MCCASLNDVDRFRALVVHSFGGAVFNDEYQIVAVTDPCFSVTYVSIIMDLPSRFVFIEITYVTHELYTQRDHNLFIII